MILHYDILGIAAALALLFFTMVWLISVIRTDASIVDLFWGPGFVLLAWFYRWSMGGGGLRGTLGLVLVTVWGVRLGLHLSKRNLGGPEDYRYQEMRHVRGEAFWWVSLFTVFWLQAGILWLVSFPLLHLQSAPVPIGWLGWAGFLMACTGFLFEAIGDRQLANFRDDPARSGEVLDEGLWRYTRHPNYFGDALFWWGLTVLAIDIPGWWWILPGPILMTVLLMKVSGVTLLEARLRETKPGYAGYAARTNAFFPWFPRGSARGLTKGPPPDGGGP